MIIRNIDSNNDWVFGKGTNSYAKDEESIIVDIKTRLQSWKYDCFFARGEGVDYKNYLGRGTKTLLELDIKRVVLQTQGVLRINSFDSVLDDVNRNLTITMYLYTIYGDINNFTITI